VDEKKEEKIAKKWTGEGKYNKNHSLYTQKLELKIKTDDLYDLPKKRVARVDFLNCFIIRKKIEHKINKLSAMSRAETKKNPKQYLSFHLGGTHLKLNIKIISY
jgi:hypothetical protein